ncbi:hypothetical protein GQ42DRAFT_165500 [Ramicandelaber brevisporus]|nr:hypothetical protein GQ42DRAFT_165500 [Ramicandelaber brevisporus]
MAAATATAGVTGRHAHFSTTPAAKASVVLTTSDPVTQLIGSQGRISVGEAANGAGVPMRGSVASIIRIPAEKALASAGGRSKSPSSGKRRRRGHTRRVPMTFETFHVREYPDMIKSVTSVADMSDFYVDDFEPLSPEYSEPETIASASTSGTRIVLAISMEPPALKQSAGGSGSGNVLDMIRQRERRQRGHLAQMTRLLEKIMASNELDCACVAVSETLVNVVFPPGVTLEQAKMFVETLGSDPYSDAFEFIEQQQQQQQQQQQLSEEQSVGSGVTMSVGSSDPEIDYIISQVDHLMSIDLSARL